MNIPKRLAGPSPAHNRSKLQERETARRLGGVVVKGSGSGDERGDVRLRGLIRLEAKTTSRKSFSVTPDILDKLDNAVFGSGEIPIIQVELECGKRRVIIMPDWALELVAEALQSRETT